MGGFLVSRRRARDLATAGAGQARSLMALRNLHLTMTPVRYESRLLKETRSLLDSGIVEHVSIVGLHEADLAEYEEPDAGRSITRVVLRSRNLPRHFFAQLVKYCELTWHVARLARRQRIGLVNIHGLDLLPLGVFLKWIRGARLVYDTHELEAEIAGNVGWRKRLARGVERALIRFVDLTIVVTRSIQSCYVEAYGDIPIVAVMNCPPFQLVERSDLLRAELGIPAHSTIYLYQGAFFPGRGIDLILRTFRDLPGNDRVVVFMGYGELEAEIRRVAAHTQTVYFYPAVPPATVLAYTASADVGLSLIEAASLSYYHTMPNKFFEYLMAGLPVIVLDLPEARRIVTDHGVGVVMRGTTPEELVSAMDDLAAMPAAALRQRISGATRSYCWESQEAAMLEAYRRHLLTAG
jgi:glycosyltransferase involved in cell wall biosynthesis